MWQAQVGQALLAALQHAVERRQVLTVFNGVPGTLENMFYRVVRQRLQPQLLDLVELLCTRVGRVILVVVVQAKQRKNLVQRFDMRLCCWLAPVLSLPTRCR